MSTLGDYARFLAMLAGGGALDGARVLGSRTIAFMTSDHLGAGIAKRSDLLSPGYGFGLGFAVRTDPGIAPAAGSVGDYNWGGIAGTTFWVSPRDSLFAIFMVQAPDQREYFGPLFRNLVTAAIA
jgi:CubicO group peptidase (beta-lactamase class C family)